MKRRSENLIFSIFASIGYMLLVLYFGLMAFTNIVGRNPSPGTASFAIIIGLVCIWRLFASFKRIFCRLRPPGDEPEADM